MLEGRSQNICSRRRSWSEFRKADCKHWALFFSKFPDSKNHMLYFSVVSLPRFWTVRVLKNLENGYFFISKWVIVFITIAGTLKINLHAFDKNRCFELRRVFTYRCTRYKKNLRNKEYQNPFSQKIGRQTSYEYTSFSWSAVTAIL